MTEAIFSTAAAVTIFRDQPREALAFAELMIRARTIEEILDRDYGAGTIDVIPHYRGPDAGTIAIVIKPADAPPQLRDQVIAKLRAVSPFLLHGLV